MGLSLALLQLVQLAAVPRDLVLHCYTWYSRMHYQGTQYHCAAAAGAIICRTKEFSLPHWYSWYGRLQYQGNKFECTVTFGTIGCYTNGLSFNALLQLVQ